MDRRRRCAAASRAERLICGSVKDNQSEEGSCKDSDDARFGKSLMAAVDGGADGNDNKHEGRKFGRLKVGDEKD